MKNLIYTIILLMAIIMGAFSQNTSMRKDKFSVGVGYGFNSNTGNDGILFSNDYKHFLSDRLAINPGITIFQSINLFQNIADNGYKSHSGFVVDLSLEYIIYKHKKFNISLNIGPSFEIGDLTYSWMRIYNAGVLIEERFKYEQIYEPGFVGGIEFNWDENKKFSKTISIESNNQFGLIPTSLGIIYKIGF